MRERDLKTTDTDGVSLVTAIRQFSDTNAWAEVDRLLGIIPGVETSTGWTDLDWARYDFKVILGLKVVALRTWDKIDARHRWAKLSIAFKACLQSGELIATGYAKPLDIDSRRTVIPADKWRFLVPDYSDSSASGEGLDVVSVLVRRAASSQPSEMLEPAPLDQAAKGQEDEPRHKQYEEWERRQDELRFPDGTKEPVINFREAAGIIANVEGVDTAYVERETRRIRREREKRESHSGEK